MNYMKRPITVAESVAAQIREQILSREILGGEALRQEAIAKLFGTSIIPAREALRQLESEGLVELKSHRGAVATELTLEKALDWISLRRLIETELMDLAFDNITDEHLTEAKEIMRKFHDAMDRKYDIEHWADYNWKFHSALYKPANRPETMKVLYSLHMKCDRYIRVQLLKGDHIDRAEKEHHELIELCRKQDKPAAIELTRQHVVSVEEDLIEQLGI